MKKTSRLARPCRPDCGYSKYGKESKDMLLSYGLLTPSGWGDSSIDGAGGHSKLPLSFVFETAPLSYQDPIFY